VDWVWATRTLAQVREARLGEMVLELRMLSATSHPGKVLWVLSKPKSRSGEMASPKRDVLVMFGASRVF